MKYLLFLLAVCGSVFMTAQTNTELSYYFPSNLKFDEKIPTPESVLGHQIGEWHVSHDKLVHYLKVLAKASGRITIEDRGKTFEDRPLVLLTITSKNNHKNIEEIRVTHLKNTDVNESSNLDLMKMPLVIYQGFSVHGNEPSGANASLLLAYYLAASQDEFVIQLLENTVVLLDPSLNPDGLQRFAYWANTNKSEQPNTDRNNREFHEVWPRGRTNHYWFDLNRDWLPLQLPESQARIISFKQWMPNIFTDHHEMGSNSSFFFQPGIQSRVHPLTPKANQKLTKEIGNYHAEALDAIGSLYYTEENFDDFYYGKGSTYPDINGAIGILFEQGSSRGHAQETQNGVLRFPFTIKNQLTAAISTLKAGLNMRAKLLEYQRDFFKDSRESGSKKEIPSFVFGDEKDQAKTAHFVELLRRHKIQVYNLNTDIKSNDVNFEKQSSFIVPIQQKNKKLIQAIFEKRTSFTDSLFYDISAWTFPLAFNLNYAQVKTTAAIGEEVLDISLPEGKVSNESSLAYLMPWNSYYSPKALHKIIDKGIRAKVGMKPFSLEGMDYDYGTVLIPVQNQEMHKKELFETLTKIAKESNLLIYGVKTGLTLGIDLGSNQFKTIQEQKVAMLVGNGFSSYDSGEIWHLFDQRYQMPLTKIDVSYFRSVDISRYTAIILPSTSWKPSETELNKIKDWVKSGGTIIGFKNSVKWLSTNKLIDLKFNSAKIEAKHITFEQKRNFSGAQVIGGAIFETKIDRSHPIAFGYANKNLPMFRRTKIFIEPDEKSYNNPIIYTKSPLLSGYISKENLKVLEGTVPFQVKGFGKGKVVVFTDNTNFRAFWYGTNKLLMNAIFFSKMM